ncbi:4-hydroxybenzoate polyprenyltransferase [Candidatus Magnetomorum sp. HK-1]|nr:4-hydroxybenzoate polyprenyltransferase [Candidatus Magnetomorum sp. HK-1]
MPSVYTNFSFQQSMEKVISFGRMIKFSHTVFALPFALSAVILAGKNYKLEMWDILWIIMAMVGARSSAMGFNRIVDASIDAKNPRTANREIPSGKISLVQSIMFVICFTALYIFSTVMLGKICFIFSIPVLFLLFFYSYTKRFTRFSHIYLGFAISLAPLGAWIAVTQSFHWSITILSLALLTHIAGFDIMYSCQDYIFDRQEGLFSIPSQYGIIKALKISRLLHGISFICFVLIFFLFGLGKIYLVATMIIGLLLFIEHQIVDSENLSHIPIAFFHINCAVSIVLFAGIFGDVFLL